MARVFIVPLTRPFVHDYLDLWVENTSKSLDFIDAEVYAWPTVLKPPMDCYVWNRMQYLAPCLLKWLYNTITKSFESSFVVGVGFLDGYDEGLNFVFGEASPALRTAVVFTKRLDPRFYGGRYNFNLYVERVSKEINHELGHLLGLGHCRDKRCVMSFSNSVFDVDRKGMFFCDRCRERISALYI